MSSTSTNSLCSPFDIFALQNHVHMPIFGLGTWQSTGDELKALLKTAIHLGYRLIDTASVYGNEEAIGEAIQEILKEGLVQRKELFITTKAWTNEIAPENLEGALRESLRKLKLDYVDLYLAHMPTVITTENKHIDTPIQEIWRAFDAVHKKGLARAIGVSNWNLDQIRTAVLMSPETVQPQVSQVEVHLYFPQKQYVRACKNMNIAVTSYASLGSPGRENFTLPNGQRLEWPEAPSPLQDPNVLEIAEKYKKTAAQVLLRYLIDRHIAIIPKTTNLERLAENIRIFDFALTEKDIQMLESSNFSKRLFLQDFMIGHPQDPFGEEREEVAMEH